MPQVSFDPAHVGEVANVPELGSLWTNSDGSATYMLCYSDEHGFGIVHVEEGTTQFYAGWGEAIEDLAPIVGPVTIGAEE